MSKNRQEFIARALYAPDALRLASVPGRFFLAGGWLNIAYPADSSDAYQSICIHCELHALFSLYALDIIIISHISYN